MRRLILISVVLSSAAILTGMRAVTTTCGAHHMYIGVRGEFSIDVAGVEGIFAGIVITRTSDVRFVLDRRAGTVDVEGHFGTRARRNVVYFTIGRSRPRSCATRTASSYPASACRITPVPGSAVRTRASRSAASAVPSATMTMPA
jgi:hypothetical protein